MVRWSRRDVIRTGGSAACAAILARGGAAFAASAERSGYGELFATLERITKKLPVPQINAAIVKDGRIPFAAAIGYADVQDRHEVNSRTIQNFGSTTKPVTMTAALQLVERGQLHLAADISDVLGFEVRNPAFPQTPITLEQLLSHRSSVNDDDRYDLAYRCGTEGPSLAEWLAGYFAPEGSGERFHPWEPGNAEGTRGYSNVGYGLIGLLVERASGLSFEDYCKRHIFEPLAMKRTCFSLDAADANLAVPYTVMPEWFVPEKHFRGRFARLSKQSLKERPMRVGDVRPFCQYSLPTAPDGGMRSNAAEFAHFTAAWANGGQDPATGARILESTTVARVIAQDGERPIGWFRKEQYFGDDDRPLPGGPMICHNGADPGIGSFAGFRPETGQGIVFAFNRWFMDDVANTILEAMLPYLD